MSTVLVIAARDDWPTDRVVKALTDGGAEVFRMDTAEFPQEVTLAGRIDARRGWSGGLTTAHRAVDLANVSAVYYRAPNSFSLPATMSEPEHRFAAAQARAGLGGIITALDCRWVSHPAAMSRAEYKPLQLATARTCGLTVPPTLEDDLADLRGIDTTAHLFQAWVDKAYEVRLTVVGDRLFPAEVHAGSDAAHTDWRSDYRSLTYRIGTAPPNVVEGVRRYMDRLDLRFAAFDFVVSPDGVWTYLEANPCGQWDWIEHATGLPIAQAIADELQGVPR
ncbi:RimK domain-containing protein [Streptomyces sp. DSM 41524]|uniref:RimK domain-containing protein n=1 Tax=Streptomyces asiaticus subsp. ignotus TaxID=3098222 RepID=A0ABU7PXY3_9ACTN|nr:RimK domain-containing protein [Streptomyces sp. DSM 41524]